MTTWLRKPGKRSVLIGGGVLAALLVAYGAIVPTVVARQYLSDLVRELSTLEPSIKKVSVSQQLPMFNDPDVSLADRQAQINASLQDVEQARKMLGEFGRSDGLTDLPGTGFAGDYHTATVRHMQANNIISQSSQVLDEYEDSLRYLEAYTDLQTKLSGHLAEVNSIQNFDRLKGKGAGMQSLASTIRSDHNQLASLAPPAGFDTLQAEAAATFDRAADGFDDLARGLSRGSDAQIYQAVGELEATAIKNDVDDKSTLVQSANQSVTLQQLAELPDKFERIRGQ